MHANAERTTDLERDEVLGVAVEGARLRGDEDPALPKAQHLSVGNSHGGFSTLSGRESPQCNYLYVTLTR